MLLIKRNGFLELKGNTKVIRMANFYKNVRKKLNILVDENQKPIGGKWSFDDENRKKIPKGMDVPSLLEMEISKYAEDLKPIINKKFSHHRRNLHKHGVAFAITGNPFLAGCALLRHTATDRHGTFRHPRLSIARE